jgi:flagella basal body P-ring formation protein FlgA
MVGDMIKVRNLDTGVTVSGTVMADGSVEVLQR